MAKNRSIVSIKDGTSHVTFTYVKVNPATGANFDNNATTGIPSAVIAIYNAEDDTLLQASASMTYSATLVGFRYVWTYSGSAKMVYAVVTPTRGSGVSAALAPTEQVFADLADVLNRVDVDTAAVTTNVNAKVTEIEGVGFDTSTDSLRQIRLLGTSIANQVSALDLRNSTNLLMPTFLAAGKTYTVYLRIKDDTGQPVDADSTPAFSLIEGSITGITLSVFTRDSVGNYHATIAIDAAVPVKTVLTPRANWVRTEGTVVNNEEAVRQAVVDSFESDSAQTLANTNTIIGYLTNATYGLSALQVIVADIQTKVNNGTYGLAALRTDIDAVATQVGVDNSASLQQKIGAFTTVLTIFGLLGNGFDLTQNLHAGIQAIQGQVG